MNRAFRRKQIGPPVQALPDIVENSHHMAARPVLRILIDGPIALKENRSDGDPAKHELTRVLRFRSEGKRGHDTTVLEHFHAELSGPLFWVGAGHYKLLQKYEAQITTSFRWYYAGKIPEPD
jgi:hypothetical protein